MGGSKCREHEQEQEVLSEHIEQDHKINIPCESCHWQKGITADLFLLCSKDGEGTCKAAVACQLGGGWVRGQGGEPVP